MPLAICKRKMPNTFSRKLRRQWRASAQAPASRSIVSDLVGDTALLRPVSSNAVISACASILDVQGDVNSTEDQFARTDGSLPNPDTGMTDAIQGEAMAIIPPLHTVGNAETPKRASLLGLPVEIRIMIFERVFPPSDPKGAIETILYCAPALRVLGSSHSQLCRVNRQIYDETRGLLYGQTLVFLSREALTKFSSTRTCRQLSQIRSICLKPRVTNWTSAIKTLVLPPGASLTIHWPIAKELWQAVTANATLDYRHVSVVSCGEDPRVVFEPVSVIGVKRPTYEFLEESFRRYELFERF